MMTVLPTIHLFLYHKNLQKTKGCVWGITGCVWGMMARTIKPMKFYIIIQEAESKDSSATDEPFLLASQKSEENQVWYLGNDKNKNEINESLCPTSFVHVYFYHKGFYHCNEDHCGMCMIFWCINIISMLHNLL